MHRIVVMRSVLVLGLQVAALSAACSTPTDQPGMVVPGGGTGGWGGTAAHEGGSGGAAGTPGLGGSGGVPSRPEKPFPPLDLPEDLQWLIDPEIWTPLPLQEDWDDLCTFWEADPDRIAIPPLDWQPCGEGCARADVLQGVGIVAGNAALGISKTPGVPTPFLRVSSGLPAQTHRVTLERIIDLKAGRTVAASQSVMDDSGFYASCASYPSELSGLATHSFRGGSLPKSVILRGSWDLEAREWIWQLPWPTRDDIGFDVGYCKWADMEAGGRTFYLCGNVIRGAIYPGSSEISVVDVPGDAGHVVGGYGSTLGDLLVWPELKVKSVGSRVRAWTPGGGLRTILDDVPVDTCAVGLSDTRVAGFSTAGACDSFQPDGRLWIAERGENGNLVRLRLGPVFWPRPVTEIDTVATWGDHIAVAWGERIYERPEDRRRLLLARVTDWAMRDIRAPEGYEVWSASLTDEHLYVIFSRTGAGYSQFSEVVRYELDKYDLIGEPLSPVESRPMP